MSPQTFFFKFVDMFFCVDEDVFVNSLYYISNYKRVDMVIENIPEERLFLNLVSSISVFNDLVF